MTVVFRYGRYVHTDSDNKSDSRSLNTYVSQAEHEDKHSLYS